MPPLTVSLLPSLGAGTVPSMSRYPRELAAALAENPRVTPELLDPAIDAPPGRGTLGRLAFRHVRYPRLARRVRADVHHVTDHSMGHLVASLPATRTVVTCHDLMVLRSAERGFAYGASRLTVPLHRHSLRRMRRAARVICVSRATRDDVAKYLDVTPERLVVIPNGLHDRFHPATDAKRAAVRRTLPPGLLLLHPSSGLPYKNVRATIETLGMLATRGHDPLLVRTGPPLDPQLAARAAELGVGARVLELGHVDDARLVELVQSADVLIFPSFWEGFGWPPLEALGCGTPVVVSDIAPLREATGGAALAAAPEDHTGLAEAVERLVTSVELRGRLREKGLGHAAGLRWPRVADRYADVYEEVVAPRRATATMF